MSDHPRASRRTRGPSFQRRLQQALAAHGATTSRTGDTTKDDASPDEGDAPNADNGAAICDRCTRRAISQSSDEERSEAAVQADDPSIERMIMIECLVE